MYLPFSRPAADWRFSIESGITFSYWSLAFGYSALLWNGRSHPFMLLVEFHKKVRLRLQALPKL